MRLPRAPPSCGVSMGILPRVTEPGAPKAEARAVSQQEEQAPGMKEVCRPARSARSFERDTPSWQAWSTLQLPLCPGGCPRHMWVVLQDSWSLGGPARPRLEQSWRRGGGGGCCIMRPSWEDSYEGNTSIFMSSPSVLSQAALCPVGIPGCLKTRMPERKANLFMPQT